MGKTVKYAAKSKRRETGNAEDWIKNRPDPESDKRLVVDEPTKKLSFLIPLSLHKRIRVHCAQNGLVMAEELRDFLEEKFPSA